MPPTKHWYQLSILQLLVAMAIVAVFITVNLKVRRVEVLGMWVAFPSKLETQELKLSSGWPFTVLEAKATGTASGERDDL